MSTRFRTRWLVIAMAGILGVIGLTREGGGRGGRIGIGGEPVGGVTGGVRADGSAAGTRSVAAVLQPERGKESDLVRADGEASSGLAGWAARPWGWPTLPELKRLTPPDLPAVLRLYRSSGGLTNRVAATVALAWLGGEEAVTVLTNTLGAEFAGTELADEEWRVMETTMQALGFLATSSDRAREFLLAGLDGRSCDGRGQWGRRGSWTVADSREYVASMTWEALGMTKCAGVERIRGDLRAGLRPTVSRWAASGAVCGAFKAELMENVGPEEFFGLWVSRNGFWDRFQEWKRSKSGEEWQAWYAGLEDDTK